MFKHKNNKEKIGTGERQSKTGNVRKSRESLKLRDTFLKEKEYARQISHIIDISLNML
jgi:hypothetical protein